MSSDFDGTSGIKGDQVTGDKLDRTLLWHGTTLPTNPTNEVPTNGLFLKTDSSQLYENTGTLAAPVWTLVLSASGTKTFMEGGLLTAGENLAANDAVMIDGNLTVLKVTSTKERQGIGIMVNAVNNTVLIGAEDMIVFGVADYVCGTTVTAGDSLIAGATTARLYPENSTVPTFSGNALGTHNHTFTGDLLAVHDHAWAIDAGLTQKTISSLGDVINNGKNVAITEEGGQDRICLAHTTGATTTENIDYDTSNKSAGTPSGSNTAAGAGTPTGSISAHVPSKVFAMALESGTVGQTKKCLVCLRG